MYKGRAALGRNPNCTVRTAGCQLVYSRWRILFPIVLLDGFWQFAPSVNATHAHVSPQRQTRSTSTLPTFPSSLSEKLHRLTNQMKSGSLRKQSRAFEQNTMLSKSDDLSTPAQNQSGGKHTGFNSFLAGGLAGSIATIVTSPIEVVKTQLQASSIKQGSNGFSVAGHIMKTEGPRGFFRGLAPGLVGIIPARSVYFAAYSKSKEFWTNDARLGQRHRDVTEVLCGLTAGLVQNTITNPIWMVKTRMQLLADTATGQIAYGGYRQAIEAIWRVEGFKGFYKGIAASYWGCSEGCIYFILYERLKRHLRQRQNDVRAIEGLPPIDSLSPGRLFASSAVSKLCATIMTYPHEVVRTRLREQARNGVFKYTGMWQSLFLVAREEGRRGLYAGMGAHVARVVPNMAIMMLSYEVLSDWLNRGDGEARCVSLLKR